MNVPSFVGDSILGRFSLREKDGPGLLLPRGNFMLYPFSGRKSNTDQFFQEGGLCYNTGTQQSKECMYILYNLYNII